MAKLTSGLVVLLLASILPSFDPAGAAIFKFEVTTTPGKQYCKGEEVVFRIDTLVSPPVRNRAPADQKLNLQINFDDGGTLFEPFQINTPVDKVTYTYTTTGDKHWQAFVTDPLDGSRQPGAGYVTGTVTIKNVLLCEKLIALAGVLTLATGLYTFYKTQIKKASVAPMDLIWDWGDGTSDIVTVPPGTTEVARDHTYPPAPSNSWTYGVRSYVLNDPTYGSALIPGPTCNNASTCATHLQQLSPSTLSPTIGKSLGNLRVGALSAGTINARAASATALPEYDMPIAGVNVTYSAPTSGPSCTFFNNLSGQRVSSLTVQAGFDGAAFPECTANDQVGSYAVTATTPGVAQPVTWQVTNERGSQPFTQMSPSRIWDSRVGPGPVGRVGAGQSRDIAVTGVGGVPATGVTAVVLNVTAVNPSAFTHVKGWTTGEAEPTGYAMNEALNTNANLVTISPGAGGKITIRTTDAATDLIVDVSGWYGLGASQRFTSISPTRVWDSRVGPGPVGRVGSGGYGSRTISVTGLGGVPVTGVSAVELNVTMVTPSAAGWATIYPYGESQPLASNINVSPGDVRANSAIVKVSPDGKVNFYTELAGDTDVILDVAGYFSSSGATFTGSAPLRSWDTRGGFGPPGILGPGETRDITLLGVPASGATVVVSVGGFQNTAETWLTVWPTGEPRPQASSLNLNLPYGQTRRNQVTVKVGAGGKLSFFNGSGSVGVLADVVGWYSSPGLGRSTPPPPVSGLPLADLGPGSATTIPM